MKYGLSPSDYWEMSYDEIGEYVKSKVEKEKEDYIRNLQITYYGAVFHGNKNAYKVFNQIVKSLNKKEMTDDEMENMARSLNAMFKKGGD
jgi:hypothetical protein